MTISLEVLEAEMLSLPVEQRSQLFDRLLASLDRAPVDTEWENAWAQEADHREAEIEAGRASWLPGDEVVARLRARLK